METDVKKEVIYDLGQSCCLSMPHSKPLMALWFWSQGSNGLQAFLPQKNTEPCGSCQGKTHITLSASKRGVYWCTSFASACQCLIADHNNCVSMQFAWQWYYVVLFKAVFVGCSACACLCVWCVCVHNRPVNNQMKTKHTHTQCCF